MLMYANLFIDKDLDKNDGWRVVCASVNVIQTYDVHLKNDAEEKA